MERRTFLAASLAASASGLSSASASSSAGAAPTGKPREFYLLRRYSFTMGAQPKAAAEYFTQALLPALGRLGLGPIGAFELAYGPETPAYYLLVPAHSADQLALLDEQLAGDTAFQQAAQPFWSAPAAQPAFTRVDSSLLHAFAAWPALRTPAAAGQGRILQLRTYASATSAAHVRKVEMFNAGECDLFDRMGCRPVFFAANRVGSGLPSLTYMLSFAGMAELEAGWARFVASPEWKAMSGSPRYSAEELVSTITNLVLRPLACSQV
jgi:hypothetical protein